MNQIMIYELNFDGVNTYTLRICIERKRTWVCDSDSWIIKIIFDSKIWRRLGI
jgi:hypothetical protein